MTQGSIFRSVVFTLAFAFTGLFAVAEHSAAQEFMLATHLGSGRSLNHQLQLPGSTTEIASVSDYLPADYFAPDAGPVSHASGTRTGDRKEPNAVAFENWVVVASLGLSFCLGLLITLTTVRRHHQRKTPTRIF